MRLFPRLQSAQDCLIELLSTFDPELGWGPRGALAIDICEASSRLVQIRREIVHPRLMMAGLETRLIDDAAVDFSLVSLLLDETLAACTAGRDFDVQIRAVGRLLEHRFALEEAPGGLWAAAAQAEIDVSAVDLEIRCRMLEQGRRRPLLRPPSRRGCRSFIEGPR